MFQFTRCPSLARCLSVTSDGFPHSDTSGCLRLHTPDRSVSSCTTSFVGTRRLGIPCMPLFAVFFVKSLPVIQGGFASRVLFHFPETVRRFTTSSSVLSILLLTCIHTIYDVCPQCRSRERFNRREVGRKIGGWGKELVPCPSRHLCCCFFAIFTEFRVSFCFACFRLPFNTALERR
jgi:hypothetical protein